MNSNFITVQVEIDAPITHVWDCFTQPEHITQWNFASPDWYCPSAENDMQVGGKMNWRMEAKDGSFGFDFEGTYTKIEKQKTVEITLGDKRKMEVLFAKQYGITTVAERFEAENTNPAEMQKAGWQAILNSFKAYAQQEFHR